ncbi:MAG: amidohydrolase family protein, partial [Alphaproteobacteria bacterium]
ALESPFERAFWDRRRGRSVVEHLADIGLLGPRTSLAHGTWATERDIEICARTGTTVCHNPSSNLRLRNGIAPVARMLEAGVNVAIGIDSYGLSSGDDMLEEMRLAGALARLPPRRRFRRAPDSFDVLRMASVNGAKATTLARASGTLVAGGAADAVLIDLEALSRPYLDERVHVVDALVSLGRPEHVDSVMIAGRLVLSGGRFVTLDEESVARELAAVAKAGLTPAVGELASLARDLRPHLTRYYDERASGDGASPYYAINSRF